MAIDGFFTRALVKELRDTLEGGRIHKIYQPFEQEIQLVIRNQRTNYRLAASIHPQYFATYLTQERPSNPEHAPMFCMLLRKHLEGAVVHSIQQYENDRIVDLYLGGSDEIGRQTHYLLTIELMGRHSNILLVDQDHNKIIDCIKHVPLSMNSYRSLQAGGDFQRPPRNINQTNLFNLSDEATFAFAQEHEETLASGNGYSVVQGMGKDLAIEVSHWIHSADRPLSALGALERLKSIVDYPAPSLYLNQDKLLFTAFKLGNAYDKVQSFNSLSQLLESYYQQKVHFDRIKQLSGNMIQKIQQVIEKNTVKLNKLAQDREVARQADDYRIKGELLNAYAYQIKPGQAQVDLENYYDNNQLVTIELDPRLNAVENAQVLFKKYQKYRDALHFIDTQEDLTQQENLYLEGILIQLEQADYNDVETIKQELIDQGYVSQAKSSSKKRAKTKTQPREFQASDGTRILVGRNNQQNDELSLKISSKQHWWLHAKNIPGAHVIIQVSDPTDSCLQEAAEIAAFYSKFSQSANVPVDYVQVKQLQKPNGSKPGFVIYTGQKTLYVTPDAEKISKMEKAE